MAERTRSDEATNGNPAEELVEEWRNAAYNCFSSGHKFCREVCPVMQVTRNESHTPDRLPRQRRRDGEGPPDDRGRGRGLRALHAVRSLRAALPEHPLHRRLLPLPHSERSTWSRRCGRSRSRRDDPPGELEALGRAHRPLGQRARSRLEHRDVRGQACADWATGLDIPIGGETVLFVDCEAAFYRHLGAARRRAACSRRRRRVRPDERAVVLRRPGVRRWATSTGAQDGRAQHRSTGGRPATKRIICLDPHDYITFIEDYPPLVDELHEFEIVLGVDLVAELIRDGKLELTTADRAHRHLPRPVPAEQAQGQVQGRRARSCAAIPGLTFVDVDHVTQWSYCSGAGAGCGVEKPEMTAEISRRRVAKARPSTASTRSSRACPWSERPLAERRRGAGDRGLRHVRARRRGGRVRGLVGPQPRACSSPRSATWDVRGRPGSPYRTRLQRLCSRPRSGALRRRIDGRRGPRRADRRASSAATTTSSGPLALFNRARVPSPFPVHRWEEFVPAGGRPAHDRGAGLGGRQARQPPARPGRAARWRDGAHRRRGAASTAGSSST